MRALTICFLCLFALGCVDDRDRGPEVDAALDASPDVAFDADGTTDAPTDGSTDTGRDADVSVDTGPPVDGLSIVFDYRFDLDGFFTDPARRVTLEAAAAAWGRILLDDFETIPAGTSIRTRNPELPDAPGMSFPSAEDIDDVLIFVGCAIVDGGVATSNNTAALGSVTDPTLQARLIERYQGADFEPWTGWIAFDCDEPWFFDQTPDTDDDIPGTMADFYSTAMHEMGHVLGFGTADAFVAQVDTATFVGPAAVAVYGGPVPLTPAGVHFQSSLRSDGRLTLMDPSRTIGTRTPPTTLDESVFVDLGYEL